MNFRKTNWLHFMVGYPIMLVVIYTLIVLFKCLTD